MQTLPLVCNNGHLFVNLQGNLWLYDTGAPASFGEVTNLSIEEKQFRLNNHYMGLSAETLSLLVGVQCAGLLGADFLGHFDHIIDCTGETLLISKNKLEHSGQCIHLSEFMGIPILTARIAGNDYRMFFDTGAQLSYFQHDSLADFPSCGSITDFYPGVGQFQTNAHRVDVSLGDIKFILRCGSLPGLLGATLLMADTQGIIGNQVFENRVIGYFPRRGELYL